MKKARRREWANAAFEAGIVALVLFFFIWPVKITGTSMLQTFNSGDRAVMSRVMVYLKWLHRDDIVVCKPAGAGNDIIKRVIGTPGDRVTITGGEVFINGAKLYEPYINGAYTSGEVDVVLAGGEYYVLGDNRAVSMDSRAFGPVKKKDIIGKVLFRYYPLNKLKTY